MLSVKWQPLCILLTKPLKSFEKKNSAPSPASKHTRIEDSPSGTRSLDESGTGEVEDEPGLPQDQPVDDYTRDQHIVWLTYWVVYGVYDSVEYFADRIFFWLPFYTLLKAAFLLFTFIQINGERGCVKVYDNAVRPFFLKYQTQIENAIREGMKGMGQAGSEIVGEGSSAFTKAFSSVVSPQMIAVKFMQAAAQARSTSPTTTQSEIVPPDGKKLM